MALIGRERECARLVEAMRRSRVVSIVGPAGVGKTALARAVSANEGTRFADLSDARTPDGVLSALALPLAVRLVGVHDVDDAHARLAEGLRASGATTFVIDNCEHVRSEVARALASFVDVDGVCFVLTSREVLSVAGEHVIDLEPLDADSAVTLLVSRAESAARAISVDDEWRDTARRVVAKLDRLPLAIELLASRLDILSIAQLEVRLDEPLAVLRDPSRAHARHADLAAALRFSWGMASASEQETLRAAAVCRSGVTVDVLESALTHLHQTPPTSLLDDLSSLLRRHLLFTTQRANDGVRYHLLETVRAFVEQESASAGRSSEITRAHAHAMVAPERPYWQPSTKGVRALAPEVDNLARVLDDAALLAPLCAARAGLLLHPHFAMHGPLRAHKGVLDRAVRAAEASGDHALMRALRTARADTRRKAGRLTDAAHDLDAADVLADDDGARADVFSSRAMLAMMAGALDQANAHIECAISLAEGAGDARALARAFERGGSIALVRGEYALVEDRCARALALSEDAGHVRSTTNALTYQGIARLDRGLLDAAREAFTMARALYTAIDDAWSVAVCDAYLALIALDDGESARATERLNAARQEAKKVGHTRLEAFVDGMIGVALHEAGALALAEESCRRGLALAQHVGDLLAACVCAGHLAAILAARAGAVGDSLEEARGLMEQARGYAELLPNPSGRRGLVALDGILALAAGDRAKAEAARTDAVSIPGVHWRLASRLLEAALAGASKQTVSGRLVFDRVRHRLRLATGDEIDFSRRGPLRRVLYAIVDAHARGAAVNVHALIDQGWPDEKVGTEAGTARVYSAIKSLRKMGLEDVLVTRDDGYALREGTIVDADAEIGE